MPLRPPAANDAAKGSLAFESFAASSPFIAAAKDAEITANDPKYLHNHQPF